jgi:hypothetical protein
MVRLIMKGSRMNNVFSAVMIPWVAGCMVAARAAAQQVSAPDHASMYVTAKGSDARLAKMADLTFFDLAQPTEKEPAIFVDPNR